MHAHATRGWSSTSRRLRGILEGSWFRKESYFIWFTTSAELAIRVLKRLFIEVITKAQKLACAVSSSLVDGMGTFLFLLFLLFCCCCCACCCCCDEIQEENPGSTSQHRHNVNTRIEKKPIRTTNYGGLQQYVIMRQVTTLKMALCDGGTDRRHHIFELLDFFGCCELLVAGRE